MQRSILGFAICHIMRAMVLVALTAVPPPSMAQSVSDLGGMMTKREFDTLVDCTVARHPEQTRNAAEFRFVRSPHLTPDQMRSDPDSQAWYAALEGCYTIRNGQQLPFDFQELIRRWGAQFGIVQGDRSIEQAMAEAVNCVIRSDRKLAKSYVKNPPNGRLAHIMLMMRTHCGNDDVISVQPRSDFDTALSSALDRK